MDTTPNASPAPAATATTEPAAAAPGDKPPEQQTAPEPKAPARRKSKAERHAEIDARLKAAQPAPDGDKAPEGKPAEAKPPEKKPEEPKTDRSPGAVMRLTSEVTRLKAELERAQASTPKAEDSISALRERVKKDPAVLLEVFGDDIDADAEKRLDKLNTSVLDRADPAKVALSEQDQRIAKLEKELADERAKRTGEEQAKNSAEAEQRARGHVEKALTEGVKGADGTQVIDPAKYKITRALTKAGEVDGYTGVRLAVRQLVDDYVAGKKKAGLDGDAAMPSDETVHEMIALCAGKAEESFRARAERWRAVLKEIDGVAAEPETARTMPKTITADMGAGHGGGFTEEPGRKLTPAEKHAAINERLRKQLAAARAAN